LPARKRITSIDLINIHSDISRRLELLPSNRRAPIQRIFQQPNDFVLLSLRQLAHKLKEDPTTLSRAIRALGFQQYADFRSYLHERAVTYATSTDSLEPVSSRKGLPGLIESSLERDIKNLVELRKNLNFAEMTTVARKLWTARRIIVLASDMGVSLGAYLQYTLSMTGLAPLFVTTPGQMIHQTRSSAKSDVVIAITYGRGLRYTVEGLQQASRKSAYCVGISDTLLSPIARYCRSFFLIPTDRVAFSDSYTASMGFMNALLVAVANTGPRSIYGILKEVAEEQRTGARFFLKDNKL
jgi:RpiR family carbohydrate utilization transcriptional regulator